MNRHQVLTGAVNSGEHCFAIGSVEGINFTAYAAGCNLVILSSDFQRVQIIPGATHGNIQVGCIDCSTDTGKIAASYNNRVFIFEPTPLVHHDSTHKLDYQWYQTGLIEAESYVTTLSWNLEGTRLLTGGEVIQLWQCPDDDDTNGAHSGEGVSFHVGDVEENVTWRCIWQCRTATPVFHLKFSPDGLLFASAGKADRLVKIWYENKKVQLPSNLTSFSIDGYSPSKQNASYSFVYIAHPRAVTGFSWRKTSKYMPRGSVASMLLTSCRDNICRVWVETVLPDNGLVDLQQFEPNATQNPKYRMHRHKNKLMHRINHIRHAMHRRKHHKKGSMSSSVSVLPLPAMKSVHDFHKFGIHDNNSISPGFHFHLAASINPDTDIPLLPAISSMRTGHNNSFVVHWLDNKELHFSMEAERILQEIHNKAMAADQEREQEDVVPEEEMSSDQEEPKPEKKRKGFSLKKRHSSKSGKDNTGYDESDQSLSSLSSADQQPQVSEPQEPVKVTANDALDNKIEKLLHDWHQSADMLFSIHPVDGSFLVWLIDWLDEYVPGSFRQAQVSFSSRIPHAFPVADAISMSHNIHLYCNNNLLDIRSALLASEPSYRDNSSLSSSFPGPIKSMLNQKDNNTPLSVSLLTKHNNGSLNHWNVSFGENSKFSTVLNVSHMSRACGHRFRTNQAACHPVLPLLLTTSHHNIPPMDHSPRTAKQGWEPPGFCSELILWKVETVGPLSKSGGVTELARMNSPAISAFSDIAWLPTLLPSFSLGASSNSPSALFVASDGVNLCIYQAVIDAGSLVTQLGKQPQKEVFSVSSSISSEPFDMGGPIPLDEKFNIVSLQSTARPGCIIELESITDAKQDWQHTQLLHVFQEQLLSGRKETDTRQSGASNLEAIVDLRDLSKFEENFYLVVMEELSSGSSVLHMWKIVISSDSGGHGIQGSDLNDGGPGDFRPKDSDSDDSLYSDEEPDFGPATFTPGPAPKISIKTFKVCTQMLDLPFDVHVIYAEVAAGHLSSSSIYPACYAPYLITTACSDNKLRFWRCKTKDGDEGTKFEWVEWEMMIRTEESSAIGLPGKPISVSCAYSGRIAVAYKTSRVRPHIHHPDNKMVNCCIAIYECESTGGSEWTLEDTIEMKNIPIPDPKAEIDLNCIYNFEKRFSAITSAEDLQTQPCQPSGPTLSTLQRVTSIPSLSTIQSVKRSINEKGNKSGVLKQKHIVQLDWVSMEDGSHILTVGVGSRILMYATVSSEITQGAVKSPTKSQPTRGILQKSKSMTVENYVEQIRWMKLRAIDLTSADGLPPLPMHMTWGREGILVVGMDNEMHVYAQWKADHDNQVPEGTRKMRFHGDETDSRNFPDHTVSSSLTSANLSKIKSTTGFKVSYSVPSLMALQNSPKHESRKQENMKRMKSLSRDDSSTSLTLVQDVGLFEAAELANPVLPQYHPKQLLELLNCGKIQRVKAILAHLVKCISGGGAHHGEGGEEKIGEQTLMRQSSFGALATSPTLETQGIPEDMHLDYIEIDSIPPLPLHALFAADKEGIYGGEGGRGSTSGGPDYTDLFTIEFDTEELEDPFAESGDVTDSSGSPGSRTRLPSFMQGRGTYYFGQHQAHTLTRKLTHIHLPGLSSLDQMYLLALADTVANVKLDLSDRFSDSTQKQGSANSLSQPRDVSQFSGGAGGYASTAGGTTTESVDDCGLRYMLAMRRYTYLLRMLPLRQRAQLNTQGLSPAEITWAFHSESQEELLSMIPGVEKCEPTWTELKQFGVGWWLTNRNLLRRCVEQIAKTAFQANKDPLDAALYYLAMKKKTLLWGLFRTSDNKKMVDFFRNDFTTDRWRRAALKNAFALLGRQRFEHAAAFFLLAGSVKDAVEVCINQMHDMQLALVIVQMYEAELEETMPAGVKKLLNEEILGFDEKNTYHKSKAHPDPFLRSMAYWRLKDYVNALATLLETDVGYGRSDIKTKDELSAYSSDPCVFNFYNYLRTHPLLIRQHLASTAQDKHQAVLLSGFSHGDKLRTSDHNVTYVDKITPVERRLYFYTAHTHLKAGCPLLALEVLSKLPEVIKTEELTDIQRKIRSSSNLEIETGTFNNKVPSTGKLTNGNGFDWDKPVAKDNVESMDWSQPVKTSSNRNTANGIDWGAPVSNHVEETLELDWGDDDNDSDKSDSEVEMGNKIKFNLTVDSDDDDGEKQEIEIDKKEKLDVAKGKFNNDIMAQQLKFIACLKILMAELSTLATGFEVDGGQLRCQLYIWLEKEVEVLKRLCNYGDDEEEEMGEKMEQEQYMHVPDLSEDQYSSLENSSDFLSVKPCERRPSIASLHEIIKADKMDLKAKLQRTSRRKRWLKSHEHLLRTLLTYCSLHGASGGGLVSVKMELMLLLQELQQEKVKRQLLSPLPFPTTLPLLSACVATTKTITANPIYSLQNMTRDILHSITEFKSPPSISNKIEKVFVLRNLSAALSACIYQSLCDSDSFTVSMSDKIDVGLEGFMSTAVVYKDSHLMAGARKTRRSHSGEEPPTSAPAKWPGVSQLRSLLRDKDEDLPKLNKLLCESFVAVYVSLIIYAMSVYEANLLYRLITHNMAEQMWGVLFGGGIKRTVHTRQESKSGKKPPPRPPPVASDIAKQRMRLHDKLMGPPTPKTSPAVSQNSSKKQGLLKYDEKFVPPRMNMITYLMQKPVLPNLGEFEYDSDNPPSSDEEEEFEEDVDDGPYQSKPKPPAIGTQEHLDPNSYSWCLMRFAIIKHVLMQLNKILPIAGLEVPELPVSSPLLHSVLRTLDSWKEVLQYKLDLFNGPPTDYIPGCYVDSSREGPPLLKYKAMLEPFNTPFQTSHHSALPAKRLWLHLVRTEKLQEVFIRYIFKKRKLPPEMEFSSSESSESSSQSQDTVKIIHKENDVINAFCINQGSLNVVSLATHKEVIEIDISAVLNPPSWLEDETEYDIESIQNPNTEQADSDFLVVSTPYDKPPPSSYVSGATPLFAGGPVPQSQPINSFGQTGRGGSVEEESLDLSDVLNLPKGKGIHLPGLTHTNHPYMVVDRSKRLLKLMHKRSLADVRKIGAHPHLPYYLTGCHDGSVRMWEWGHTQCLAVPRQPGCFPKVTKLQFNTQGNKFGVSDGEGSLSLWQVGFGTNMSTPFLTLPCHNKTCGDFSFVGSSSLLATAGYSSESKNVCLWDTLLPHRSALVQAFTCHEHGSPAIVYAPQHQVLISGGKKGDICIFDIRQRQLRHTFLAHDSAVKCLALDPSEDFFVTGSNDGDIKVWALGAHNLIYSFPGEHSKSSLFRATTTGVLQVAIGQSNHLFSCGADGSMKVRLLPEKDLVVQTYSG